jgi:pyridoxamine 5'-phosphate oxidase family protein
MWTDKEKEFLDTQRIGRLATIGPSGPQVRPVGFRINRELDTVDVGGIRLSRTQKWRNVRADGRVAFVVDDLGGGDEFAPRGVEVRGRAETVEDGTELIRIRPDRIISWGLDSSPFGPTVRRAAGSQRRG